MRRKDRLTHSAPPIRAPEFVIAYHGCSVETAERISKGESLRPSQNRYDWLGSGIYFWEYAPFRARDWAVRHFGEQGIVLEARIELGFCLNLLDIEHAQSFSRTYSLASERAAAQGQSLPQNHADGRHYRDREIIELYCHLVRETTGATFQTVRACYPEGEPVFPDSRILSKTHVQISVRDLSCISILRSVEVD